MPQAATVMPTIGTVSGLTLVTDINAALAAIVSHNSGATAPSATAPTEGQFWLDTSTTPRTLRIYDGIQWVAMGTLDDSGHLWMPVTSAQILAALGFTPASATALALKLDASAYTAADVLAKLLTVDGSGSGLDADTVRGATPTTFGLALLAGAVAAASDVQAGTNNAKPVTPAGLAGSAAIQALTYGSTTSWNMASGYNAKVTLTGVTTFSVSGQLAGLPYTLFVTQDGTGGRTASWPASFNWGAAGAPTLSTAGGKTDIISLMCTDASAPTFVATLAGKGF
ncbi:MAG: hypothetical protein P4L82_12240 [Ancalomicrobiaceae bacterium]|nr:hypothetical protein [Ancalomicrobiaceae bacterium]